jgi:hypothetical protein
LPASLPIVQDKRVVRLFSISDSAMQFATFAISSNRMAEKLKRRFEFGVEIFESTNKPGQ